MAGMKKQINSTVSIYEAIFGKRRTDPFPGPRKRGISPFARAAEGRRGGTKYIVNHGTNYAPWRAHKVSKKERNKAKKLARKAAA